MTDVGELNLIRTGMGIAGTHVLGALIRLGVLDALDDDGTQATELADRLGVSPDVLTRLLRAGTGLGACAEVEPGRFALTGAGRSLRSDHPSGEYAFVRMLSEPLFLATWPGLERQARTGEVAFDVAHGRPFFAHMAAEPGVSELFNTAMRGFTYRMAEPLAERGGFDRFGTVVDVGGGNGTLLSFLLAAHPALRGVLFDLPDGAAQAPEILAAAGVEDRCTVETGDFFTGVPAGGDAYLLKNVLHDWPDDRAVTILSHCRDALPRHGRVLVVETALPDTAGPGVDALPYLTDMIMLLFGGGQERSQAEYHALFRRAGLEPAGTVALPSETGFSVLEAVRA